MRQQRGGQQQYQRGGDAHADEPRRSATTRRSELLWRDRLELLEQFLAALVAELVGGGLVGGLGGRAGNGFAHQVDGLLESLVELGELDILRQFLVEGGGLVVRQFA